VGGRLPDGGEVDAEELGALLQRAAMGRVRVGSWASQACMPGSLDEHTFEQQREEPGEDHGPDIDHDR
jgi:hypothetical protein